MRALIWLGLFVALFLAPLQAQSTRATVRLDGRAIFEVSAPTRAQARARADEIEARLARLLESNAPLSAVQIVPEGANLTLKVGTRRLTSVSPDDGDSSGLTRQNLARQWKTALDDALQSAKQRRTSALSRFSNETQSSVQTAFARLLESAILVVPRLLAGALVLGFFWVLASLTRWSLRLILRRFIADLTLENLIKQVAYYTVWALGLVVATSALGLDPQALATGLGLSSVALGFALKDILSNFVAGILILLSRPFEIGDQIVIGETEGSVERISLRATLVKTYDGRAVLVPNAEVFTSRITNNTAAPFRRNSISVPVGYGTDLTHATQIAAQAAQSVEGVAPSPEASVRVRECSGSDIWLDVRFWSDSRRSDFVATASGVRAAVVAAFACEGIGLPEPDKRVVTLENGQENFPNDLT